MTDSCKRISRLISDSGSRSWLAALTLATPLLLYSLSRMLTNDAAKWCTDNVGRMFTRGRKASRCAECQLFVHCHSFVRAILFIQVYYQCIVLSCSIVDLSTKSKFVNKFSVDASQWYSRIVFWGKVLFLKKNTLYVQGFAVIISFSDMFT